MPSPIAHSLVAVMLGRRLTPSLLSLRGMGMLLYAGFFSMLPDIDAVVGIGLGDLGRYHNNMTHSLGFIALVGLATWSVTRLLALPCPRRWAAIASGCMLLHVLMDFVTVGRGVMLLWPLTSRRFAPPVTLFHGLHWSEGLWSRSHLITAATELAIMLPLTLWVLWRGRRRVES